MRTRCITERYSRSSRLVNRSRVSLTALLTMGVVSLFSLSLFQAPEQTRAAAGSVLTVVLRDSYGKPLVGVQTQVLSYDWGLKPGQPYAVIAQGETDKNGVVAFDNSLWPYGGYRFRFTPTDHTQPASTYFMSEADNQYRGYPAIRSGAWGQPQTAQQTEYFVVGADGLAYNDMSGGKGAPTYDKDPVGGMNLPRISPQAMSSQNYLATARAATATAYAEGVPTQTLPPPPVTFGGVAEPPLSITPSPAPDGNSTPTTPLPSPASPGAEGAAGSNGGISSLTPTPQPTYGQRSTGSLNPNPTTAQSQAGAGQPRQTDETGSIVLAVVGIVCLFWFFRKKNRIYALLGVDQALIELPNRKTDNGRKTKVKTKKTGLFKGFAQSQAQVKKAPASQVVTATNPVQAQKEKGPTKDNRNTQSEIETEEEV